MIGESISHYRILEPLGSGAMGEVFVAEDLRLERRVALKLLSPRVLDDPERLERLQREAKTLARLRHPSIVTLHELEEHQGRPVLVMELVEGRTLADLIPKDGMDAPQILELAIQVTDALVAAHEAGVVHRDLKPGNILVGDDGRVKVCDFGLAFLGPTDEASQESTQSFTESGILVGTLPYMAPEQLRGASHDPRSDLFSLGVILYEMATGERPFQGHTVADLASEILHHEPPSTSVRRPSLPRDLGRIVNHCLRKDPDVRYQTAKGLRSELMELAESLRQDASGAGWPGRRLRWRPPAWFRTALLGMALLGGALALGFLIGKPRVEDGPRFQDTQVRALVEQAADYERRGDNPRDLEHAESVLRRALEIEPGSAYLEARLAALLARLQKLHPTAARGDEIRALVTRSLAAEPGLAPAWAARAQVAVLAGRWAQAEEAARHAMALDPGWIDAYRLAGEALLGQGRPDEAIAETSKALVVEGKEAQGRLALAKIEMLAGRYNEAAADYEKVLQVMPDSPNAQNNLGLIYLSTGRSLDAVPLLRSAFDDHPEDDEIATNLGFALFNLGRYEEAAEVFRRAHELMPDKPTHERNLADTYEAMGDLEAMRHWLEEALEDYDRDLESAGPDPSRLAERAVAAAKLGRFSEARRDVESAVALAPDDPYVLFYAAQVAAMQDDGSMLQVRMREALKAGFPRDPFRSDPAFEAFRAEPWFSEILLAPAS